MEWLEKGVPEELFRGGFWLSFPLYGIMAAWEGRQGFCLRISIRDQAARSGGMQPLSLPGILMMP